MTEEQLSALERECVDHFLRWLRGFTTAREMWYLIALEQEHFASREALQMMEHVGKHEPAAPSSDGVINDWVAQQGNTEEARQVARDVVGWLLEDEV